MLKQRVITALVLLAVFLPALFHPDPSVFAALCLALIAAGAWEWGRLNALTSARSMVLAGLCLMVCLLLWGAGAIEGTHAVLWRVAGGSWLFVCVLLLHRGVAAWQVIPSAVRVSSGLVVLVLAWLAMAQARSAGINFLLSIFTLVWAADIGAYFCGRAFGGRWVTVRLAPTVSPGKSWEGAIGGFIAVLLLGFAWTGADEHWGASVPSIYTLLWQQGWWVFLASLTLLTAMSVMGDLVESLVKRAAGVKDSSGLLPGHGGVLDRVDALLPTLPAAMMLARALHT